MASVEFEQVSKTYSNGYSAIENFSLEIEDGEFLVLVGPLVAENQQFFAF